MPEIPFTFFAFANSEQRYLPSLKKEERGILDQFIDLKHKYKLVDFDHREQTSSRDFFDILTKVGDKAIIIHYSGHAGSLGFDLGEEEYSLEQFATLISGLNNLKLLFLNGCSTGEMVNLLLDKGVKAVIATSEDILDNKATDFSLRFYEAFSVQGKTLEKAFKEAVSTLKNSPIKESDAIISRGAVLRKKIAERETIPWALYHLEENKHILQWKLIETKATKDIDAGLLKRIETKKQEIKTEHKKRDDLEIEVNDHKEIINDPSSPQERVDKFTRKLERDIEQLEKVENTIGVLYSELKSIIFDHDKLDLKDNFKTALFKLNYTRQISFFNDNNQPIGAYLLQGSPLCGQDILKQQLIEIAGFRSVAQDELFHKIKIDFGAQTLPAFSWENIWKVIKEELIEITAIEPIEIIKEIHEKYFKYKSLIFVFDNIHFSTADFNQQLICEFWFTFLQAFKPLIQDNEVNSKILLLVIDKNCQIQCQGIENFSPKEEALKKQIASKDLKDNYTHILPIITPLSSEDIKTWKTYQRIPVDIALSDESINQIITEKNGFILPTIKSLCKEAKMEDLYYKHFLKYEYQLPTPIGQLPPL